MKILAMKFVSTLTNIGSSLQTPIAILPAAGLLLALGAVFTNPDFLEMMPFTESQTVINIFAVCLQCGGIIFSNLPLIFAAGVAIGLTNNDGVAALSAIVGYLIMNVTIGGVLGITSDMIQTSNAYVSMLGIPTLQTGVLGGIIIGVVVSVIYKRFHDVQLPQALSFFAAKRSVPIITAFSSFFIGLIMCIIWPPIQNEINALSTAIANSNSVISGFFFGLVERLTIPFGMNHIWWPTFWLQAGEYVNKAGQVVHGDELIFFAQLADNVPITAGTFMNGLFVLKMFSMPAAALAMYHCAKPQNKAKVYGILMSGAITSFVCGITEPLEFCFIFCAPILFIIHAVIAGLGCAVMNFLGAHLGLSFSGGFFDFLFFNVIPNRTDWWLVFPVGIVLFIIYYSLFRFSITRWDLKTPGREDDVENESSNAGENVIDSDLFGKIVNALGGKENIVNVNACYSRLRVDVKNISSVQKEAFSHLQAFGVSILGNNVQVIYGNKAVAMKDGVQAYLKGETINSKQDVILEPTVEIKADPERLNEIISPYEGEIMELKDVPDAVFGTKAIGDGFAVNLTKGVVKAPVDGIINSIFPTKHAIAFIDKYGNEILLHIGLDTVNLNGEGFTLFVEAGENVKRGQKIVEVDLSVLKEHKLSSISPVIFTNLNAKEYQINLQTKGNISCGDKNLISIDKIVE